MERPILRSARSSAVAAILFLTVILSGGATAGVIDTPPKPGDAARVGGPLPGVSADPDLAKFFDQAKTTFMERDSVRGGTFEGKDTGTGLGPRFNLDGCASCHAYPAAGGSSPPFNLQPGFSTAAHAKNDPVSFVKSDGPTVEARFKWLMDANGHFKLDLTKPGKDKRVADGGVHALYTISGRTDAGTCQIKQPPFQQAWVQDNVTLRIPTPVYGLGLIEAIDESEINHNAGDVVLATAKAAKASSLRAGDFDMDDVQFSRIDDKRSFWKILKDRQNLRTILGIHGRPGRGRSNHSGNDSTITRFGWKAQNKSLMIFAGEAYNVEQGVTNELFPNERDEEPTPLPADCKINSTPEDKTVPAKNGGGSATLGDVENFAIFMRLLAPPKPACELGKDCPDNVVHGSAVFDQVHCDECHVRELKLGNAALKPIADQKVARLYSDLLLHHMGNCPPHKDHTPACLADGVEQGQAGVDEFRTAPLWGVGQRLFFLHDGRARDLPSAILDHQGKGSEASEVIKRYRALPDKDKQALIDFLRSL
jgi:CxxC motif-containing protein (DUF1111 family)